MKLKIQGIPVKANKGFCLSILTIPLWRSQGSRILPVYLIPRQLELKFVIQT